MIEQEKWWRKGEIGVRDQIAEAVKEFEAYCHRHAATTQIAYRRVAQQFVGSLPEGTVRVQQLASRHIQEYLNRLHTAGCQNRTVNTRLVVLKAFFRYLSRNYHVPNASKDIEPLKHSDTERHFPTPEEFRCLLSCLSGKAA